MKPGEIHVWRIRLDELRLDGMPAPTAGEAARAARFLTEEARARYLKAHAAQRTILGGLTDARLDFALHEKGKPYLPAAPELRFNLTHSRGMALVAAALDVDVGVDVEWLRPVPEHRAIAERFFPPTEAAALDSVPAEDRERDFFRRWTRFEAMLKALGVGLYGAGAAIPGEWTIEEIDAGQEFVAAVAAPHGGLRIAVHDFFTAAAY